MQHLDVHAHYHSHIYRYVSIPGSFKILLWGCNHYVHGVIYKLQQIIEGLRAAVTHEEYIPTYQFENTMCVSEAADDSCYFTPHPLYFTFGIPAIFPASICGLVHSGSRPFNYGSHKFTVSITCFLFIHFRRRSNTVTLRLVLSTHSYQYICAINSCHNNYYYTGTPIAIMSTQ